uniref:Fringe-like glycosyltransferase domain-containing protein n=1 Tax=Anopheles dirus TaxID=7168 RepID=A0A182NJ54_9DIPT
MPPPLLPATPAAPDVRKLIDDVFVTQGAAINCAALRRLLQQIASEITPTDRPCTCKCSGASRVTIQEQPQQIQQIPSKTIKPASKSGIEASKIVTGTTGRGKEKSDSDREHEVILSKLQNVQTMLKAMQQKINKIEARLPKSQSNVSLTRGTSGHEFLPKETTSSEALLKEIDEQANHFRENESKLLAVINELEQRLQKVEQLFYQKLDRLSNEFEQFQVAVESKQTNLEEATSTATMQQTVSSTEQMNKLAEFTGKLDELQRQMELLLSHRDQLPLRIEALLEEKLREGDLFAGSKKSLGSGGSAMRRGTAATPLKSMSQARTTESAATTQQVMENLSCLTCDNKNVVQRMRNGRYLAPRTSAKLAMVARRLEQAEDEPLRVLPGIKGGSRACGGSYTVVKPTERVFREVNVKFRGSNPEEESTEWWCHFDDDNYVNVPRLVRMLDDYNPTQDWYLGKPSISSPLEIFLDNINPPTPMASK